MDSPQASLSTASQTWNSLLNHTSAVAVTKAATSSTLTLPTELTESTSWLALLGQALFAMARGIPGLLIWIITFSTITLPTLLFALFSTSLTFTMNFTTLCVRSAVVKGAMLLTACRMFIILAFASMVSWIVRYRFLNMYARLPPEPQRKEPQIDLFPDTQEGDSKPGLANYLDEFLSAIKVFGYRE